MSGSYHERWTLPVATLFPRLGMLTLLPMSINDMSMHCRKNRRKRHPVPNRFHLNAASSSAINRAGARPERPKPAAARFAVIDYDSTRDVYYTPVDLDHPYITIRGGLSPSETDPRFHQQMVYAVASETLQRFEIALGRHVALGAFRPSGRKGDTGRTPDPLSLPSCHGGGECLLLSRGAGDFVRLFPCEHDQSRPNLPGQTVFTCLSHDIIAHETTHAIVDGIRELFHRADQYRRSGISRGLRRSCRAVLATSPTKRRCSTRCKRPAVSSIRRAQARSQTVTTEGRNKPLIQAQIGAANPLVQLAQQFGQAIGHACGAAQRARHAANSDDIKTKTEPHDRGAILVAAVFDAYFTIYRDAPPISSASFAPAAAPTTRSTCRGRWPIAGLGGERTAEEFFTFCARALDYCPPVDITFGISCAPCHGALPIFIPPIPKACATLSWRLFACAESLPEGANFFSEDALCWPQVAAGQAATRSRISIFGDPNGLTEEEKDNNGRIAARLCDEAKCGELDLSARPRDIEAPSFHPMFRIGPHGELDRRHGGGVGGAPWIDEDPFRRTVSDSAAA